MNWMISFPDWLEDHKDANSASQEYGRAFVVKSVLHNAGRMTADLASGPDHNHLPAFFSLNGTNLSPVNS